MIKTFTNIERERFRARGPRRLYHVYLTPWGAPEALSGAPEPEVMLLSDRLDYVGGGVQLRVLARTDDRQSVKITSGKSAFIPLHRIKSVWWA